MDFFGMENYMIKMYDHPEVVEAVTRHVCEFYLEANERFFEQAGDQVDGFFFGNDFGTQQDLICSPQHFDRFIMPWFQKFTEQAHAHGYQAILHSCGAIHKVIGRLIDMGVDCLHPLQANAHDMSAEILARDFKDQVVFFGGIDTQDLLVRATPEEVKADVRRVKDLLGPALIVSSSHESLLPDVPPENVRAMAEAAVE
jgi:uroporphyrinogen decarboxylase